VSDLDKFSYHEAIDRIAITTGHFIDNIESHPVIIRHKKLSKKASRISDLFQDLYKDVCRTADDAHK